MKIILTYNLHAFNATRGIQNLEPNIFIRFEIPKKLKMQNPYIGIFFIKRTRGVRKPTVRGQK